MAAAIPIMVALAALIAPAPAASAMEVDCSYIKDLAPYINELGVGCAAGTGTGGFSGAGWGPNSTNVKKLCNFGEPTLPQYLLVASGSSTSRTTSFRSGAGYTTTRVTKYYNHDGKLIATKTNVSEKGWEESYISDFNADHFPAEVHSYWNCDDQDWGTPTFSDMSPHTGIDIIGGETHRDASATLGLTSTLTAIPGSSSRFLYRVDAANKSSHELTGVTFDLDLADFEVSSIVSVPVGSTCSAVYRTQECDMQPLATGGTATMVLEVTLRPTSVVDHAKLFATASFDGLVRAAGTATPRQGQYHSGTTALAVPVPDAQTPVCSSPDSATGDLAPSGIETVDAGVETALQTHCLTDYHQDLHASAQHGAVSIDEFGTLRYTPTPGFVGSDTLTVHSSTSTGVSAPATVALAVAAPAVATADSYTTKAGTPLTSSPGLLSNDSIPVTTGWMIQRSETSTAHGVLDLDAKTGSFVYTPEPGFVGTDSFKYRLTGHGAAVSNVVEVTIQVTAS